MRPGLAAGNHRRGGRLDGKRLQAGPTLLEHLRASGDMTTRPHAGDQHVDPVRKVGHDLARRLLDMHRDIGRIVELLRDPRAVMRKREFGRPFDRARHPPLLRRQIKRGAIGLHQATPLHRHRLRHHQDQAIAFHRCHHREADAGVARRRFDDHAARLEPPVGFGRLDHRERDAVLDRSSRIGPLRLDPDGGLREQPADANMRRAADGLEDRVGFHPTSLALGDLMHR